MAKPAVASTGSPHCNWLKKKGTTKIQSKSPSAY
jgi:hypothetical protein